ncbi:MAG: glycoside hydrolase family 127 protein [Clostridia bacterium]|nr:glycoside hydrolase family 127 protein [Clostridia bacterium]
MRHDYKLSYLANGGARFSGKPDEIAKFVVKNQLLRTDDWKQFVRAFLNNMDTEDEGWRGEYWGKMMRGACLTYMYTKDEELYKVLTDAVIDLLHIQDYHGRISTYLPDHEFFGWDIWSRKYVLTGMQHYYDICRDEELKETIVKALSAHLDYMCEKLGDGEGQKRITLASNHWLGVNSCSVLEPVLRMYDMTKKQKYLDFADYIISTGGIEHELDLVQLALENKIKPYEYPENKAYETMSFFEGILMYYELFGKEDYLTAVTNFVEAVAETDITIIGCAGCTHELFDNSAVVQTEPHNNVMQETCVTVTWMRLLARLYRLTGDVKYAERLEKSAVNSLYGSINTHMLPQYWQWKIGGDKIGPFVFDSYAPLYNGRRGVGVGGSRFYPDGKFVYGCCACIGSAGSAIYPLTAVMTSEDGIIISSLWAGEIKAETPAGNKAVIEITDGFPVGGEIKVRLGLEKSEKFEIKLRVPENCKKFEVTFKGKKYCARGGYVKVCETFCDGDEINVLLENALTEVVLNGRTAFTYGILTLARDCEKEGKPSDLTETIELARKCKKPIYNLCTPEGEEMIRLEVNLKDGTKLLLTDYASCGKKWDKEDNCNITVWMNIK